tara:strand:+ start:382 stop:735 length:354 start_codon:yes stop_codon:yes gene_type:complete
MFEHRKYHALYFILGVLIAFILVTTLSGCKQGKTTAGITEERCPVGWVGACNDVIVYPPPVQCCSAFIPECMACQDGCTVDIWLERTCGTYAVGAEYVGWDEDINEPLWLCQAEIIN